MVSKCFMFRVTGATMKVCKNATTIPCTSHSAYDRGLSQRPNLVVIRETNMPAVLAECGFLTNAREESLLRTDSYIEKIVNGLYEGITSYVK